MSLESGDLADVMGAANNDEDSLTLEVLESRAGTAADD